MYWLARHGTPAVATEFTDRCQLSCTAAASRLSVAAGIIRDHYGVLQEYYKSLCRRAGIACALQVLTSA
jgi:hypothetical protein